MQQLLRLGSVIIAGAIVAALPAEEPLPSLQTPAKRLQAATVTVRVWNPEAEPAADVPEDPLEARGGEPATRRVTVCSGVAVEAHLVVTPIYAASDSRIRITLPGGDQATGRLRVIDEYSGLTLVETDGMPLQAITLSEDQPEVGAWVVGAAAWGAEAPLVLLGIVAGVDRALPGAAYPPLLQCDMRVTETSSGAGVVDRRGKLVGIVVAAEDAERNRGWTYAVPVRHVQRLLRSAEDAANQKSVVILKRLRPTVGMVLDSVADAVVVSRVESGSPADKAGIRVGDQVLAADGVKIRSVYQAVRPVLYKQPGDKMEFLLHREGKVWAVEVVLGGGVELPSAPFANLSRYVRPKLDVEDMGGGMFAARTGTGVRREVFAPPPAEPADVIADSPQAKIHLLEKAMDRYRQAIVYLQNRLQQERQERDELESLLQSLQQEVEALSAGMSQPAD